MAASTKTRKAAKKVVAPEPVEVEQNEVEINEARLKARERNVESRARAVAESGAKATDAQIVIYELKNRSTGETRTLIDARGDDAHLAEPWLVTNGEATVGFRTRKELGKNYSRADLFAAPEPVAPKKAKPRRVAKK